MQTCHNVTLVSTFPVVSSSINDSKRVKRMEDDGRSGHPKMQRAGDIAEKWETLFIQLRPKIYPGLFRNIDDVTWFSAQKVPEIRPNNWFLYCNKQYMTKKNLLLGWNTILMHQIWLSVTFCCLQKWSTPWRYEEFWTSKTFRKCDSSTEGFLRRRVP